MLEQRDHRNIGVQHGKQNQVIQLLEFGQVVKACGAHLTGSGESLKDSEQVEQGKDVTRGERRFQRQSLSAGRQSGVCGGGGWEEEAGRPAAVIQSIGK